MDMFMIILFFATAIISPIIACLVIGYKEKQDSMRYVSRTCAQRYHNDW